MGVGPEEDSAILKYPRKELGTRPLGATFVVGQTTEGPGGRLSHPGDAQAPSG